MGESNLGSHVADRNGRRCYHNNYCFIGYGLAISK